MYFKGQKFLVAGLSRSGDGCARFLIKRGAVVYIYDDVDSEMVQKIAESLCLLGANRVNKESLDEAIKICDVLVLSPGIPIDNPLPVAFKKLGKCIVGEEELASRYLLATAVAVTGTNGKTTTVSMIDAVLKSDGRLSAPCGNIGEPTICKVEELTYDDYAVIEISSFQLETLSSFRPHIALITNITEDHLNRHYNMENYVFLKSRLIRGLRESEFAILNYDDDRVRALAPYTKANVIWFSAKGQTNGAYLDDGVLCYGGEKIVAVDSMWVTGLHNTYNALACLAACKLLGVPSDVIAKTLQTFKGVRHRVETVNTVNGVTYINDSKGTNVDATMKAVESVRTETILLLGGKDKGYDYDGLFTFIKDKSVVHAVLYGENRYRLMESAIRCGYYRFSLCYDLNVAVKVSSMLAKSGQSVLLSPASASFDAYANYEARGEAFVKMVESLHEQESI